MACPCCNPCKGSCTSGSNCATGCRCYGGQCVKQCSGPCSNNSDCDTGCICVNGQCVTDTRARCCKVGNQCVSVGESTQCESSPTLVTAFVGTVTVAWCGLSITFGLGDVPQNPNFGIGTSGPDGFEKACGTQNWFGTDFPATYKNETKYLNIIRGTDATGCCRVRFNINTSLLGEIIINDGSRDISFGGSGSDQKTYSYCRTVCGDELLTVFDQDVNINCGGDAHKHCNELPTVTINEAP